MIKSITKIDNMISENLPEVVKAASFLTDSIAIDMDRLSDLDIDIDLSNYQKIEDDVFSTDWIEEGTGKKYVLVPNEEILDLVSALYGKDQSMLAQEILDLVDSDFFELNSKMGNKSFRVSPSLYIQLVNKCFTKDMTLANVVRDKFKNEILTFIKELEEEIDLESRKKKFITEELEDWVKSDSSRDSYNLPISLPASLKDYNEMFQGEYILGKYYFDKKIRDSLDEEPYEVFKDEVLPKLDFKFSKKRFPFLEQVKEVDNDFRLKHDDVKTYVTYSRLLIIKGDGPSGESFEKYIEDLEYGDEIRSTLSSKGQIEAIYNHNEDWCYQKNCSHDQCIEIDTTILSKTIIRSDIDYDEDGNLLIAGVPSKSENFIDQFIESKKEAVKEDIFGSDTIQKEELQKKAEKAIKNGETSKARQINEKIVLLENLEDYFYVIASLFSKIEKQVITVNGLKNVLQLVDAVRESKGLEEILQEA